MAAPDDEAENLRRITTPDNLLRQLIVFLAAWAVSVTVIIAGIAPRIQRYGKSTEFTAVLIAAFALQFALFWLPGFPALRTWVEELGRRRCAVAIGVALFLPYIVYSTATGTWSPLSTLKLIGLTAIVLGTYALFPPLKQSLAWQDLAVMAVISVPVYLGWYQDVWPSPIYLDPMMRLHVVALTAFAVLSVRPLGGVGFEWRLNAGDWLEGAKQLVLFSVVGIPLGFALRFIAWHPRQDRIAAIIYSFVGIFLFIAVAEELFFRGILQNLLERSMSSNYGARAAASALFGLSHIHHGFPNWRYVIMAAIAGWFYGTAWHKRRNIISACVVHASVDTLWRHFLTV